MPLETAATLANAATMDKFLLAPLQKARIAAACALGFPRWLRLPLVGDIDNRFASPEVQLRDPRFGESQGLPFVMEIPVDTDDTPPAGVGKKVDDVFFQHRHKLLFNVSFACGKPQGLWRRGVYGDPRSIWFNVFFGYYEIDVEQAAWGRPFGYEADGKTVHWDDVLRIGKSDWNYFSNWMYGVPDAAIDRTNQPLRGPHTTTTHHGRTPINGRHWDVLELSGVDVVSAYDDGSGGLVDRELWSFLWRASYGFPLGKKVVDEPSFFSVPMKAKLYMAWREAPADNDLGAPAFQTFLFGGTINQRYSSTSAEQAAINEAFLQAQIDAVVRVMKADFSDLGF
jgi:hypothetical protein